MRIMSSQRSSLSSSRHRDGRVTLVGAGPGDPELLTLKALRVLQSADVVLFDDLVSDAVLDLVRREARRMLVGKRGGRKSCKQEDINETMIALARAGNHVVRLKSGDPMIFGRAGEEIAALDAQGIPVDIVPGITSALAMASALGVSLTHRDHAQAVRFVTAHSRHGDLPENVDWRGIAHPGTTTVFYMGGRMAPRLAQRLLNEGAKAATPVSAVSSLTRPDETRWSGTLGELASGAASFDLGQPIVIGVGQVFADARAQLSVEHGRSVAS
ncbi:MAG: uroporphyrinogen-III C-methyltransferase [Parvibaculum sp.]|nr:uroporphyrinogen-III C-methyltransferase [Parvibaculum sp.]